MCPLPDFSPFLLIPFVPMEPRITLLQEGVLVHVRCCCRWAAIGASLELMGDHRNYTGMNGSTLRPYYSRRECHGLPLPPSSTALCVSDTFTLIHVCPLPGTDESSQDPLLQREIQGCTKFSVLHSGPLRLVAPQPELFILSLPWVWLLKEVISPSGSPWE